MKIESACATHIAGRGERPGLLSLPLLFPWSIAPFISSRMALARELRVGLPMEAVVYRGMLFSAIEAWKAKPEALNVKRKPVVSTFSVSHHSFMRVHHPKDKDYVHVTQWNAYSFLPFKVLSEAAWDEVTSFLPGRQQRGSDHSPSWSECSSLRLDFCKQKNSITTTDSCLS